MKKYQAVIFDLDGVIVSTDDFHYQSWKYIANFLNINFNKEINHALRGVSRKESLEIILKENQLILPETKKEDILVLKNQKYLEFLSDLSSDQVNEDVFQTLKMLKKQSILTAIGSSSKNAKLILNKIGFMDWFDVVMDGTDIQYTKPHPEVFLLAAQHLGLSPKQCLVVEDAKAGVQSALNGGFDCAGINDAKNDDQVTYQIEKISDILDLIT